MTESLLCHTNIKIAIVYPQTPPTALSEGLIIRHSHHVTFWKCTTEAVSVGSKWLSRISGTEMVEWNTGMTFDPQKSNQSPLRLQLTSYPYSTVT